MNPKDFELLTEILDNPPVDKERIKLKSGRVIKADIVDVLRQSEKEIIPAKIPSALPASIKERVISQQVKNQTQSSLPLPRIEAIRQGEAIEYILVYCRCGEIIRIDFET